VNRLWILEVYDSTGHSPATSKLCMHNTLRQIPSLHTPTGLRYFRITSLGNACLPAMGRYIPGARLETSYWWDFELRRLKLLFCGIGVLGFAHNVALI
jgi:hypothetical protein